MSDPTEGTSTRSSLSAEPHPARAPRRVRDRQRRRRGYRQRRADVVAHQGLNPRELWKEFPDEDPDYGRFLRSEQKSQICSKSLSASFVPMS